jgi:hypothetical protein
MPFGTLRDNQAAVPASRASTSTEDLDRSAHQEQRADHERGRHGDLTGVLDDPCLEARYRLDGPSGAKA